MNARKPIETLKKDYQSVLGVGKTEPDPKESKVISAIQISQISDSSFSDFLFQMIDKIQVPLGKPAASKVAGSSLLCNEYIVYDVVQVYIPSH